ncbi:MAG: hypothetical protein HYZ68_06250 [Chloroflexi bacterium]|nr:hypothetical protein [Chloroflexota bacterium]
MDSYPHAAISVSIVWINMLGSDTEDAARRWAPTIEDPRARHFYDPQRRAGRAIAQSLGGQGKIAWDIYLFYDKDSEWNEGPPMPIDWVHQLTGSSWADAARYHVGDRLAEKLRETMKRLTEARP